VSLKPGDLVSLRRDAETSDGWPSFLSSDRFSGIKLESFYRFVYPKDVMMYLGTTVNDYIVAILDDKPVFIDILPSRMRKIS